MAVLLSLINAAIGPRVGKGSVPADALVIAGDPVQMNGDYIVMA